MEEKIDHDVTEEIESLEAHSKVPLGWKIYFGATVAWMIYYVYAYTPIFTGWTQSQALDALTK